MYSNFGVLGFLVGYGDLFEYGIQTNVVERKTKNKKDEVVLRINGDSVVLCR